ncbi:MAG: molybdopterin dinucleotide binding domain-containing protein, partial [Microthrixaceae bacterium]
SKVKQSEHGVALASGPPGGEFLGKRVMTSDGRIDLAPADFLAHARTLGADYEAEFASRDRLRLITRRERHSHNTWTHNAETFVGGNRHTNRAFLHPADAAKAGLAEGDIAEITSSTGKIRLPVQFDDDLMPGVVAIPHGWGHRGADGLAIASEHPGVNVNELAPDGAGACEPLSGMARLTAIDVELSPA